MIKKNSPAKLGSLQKLYLAVLRLHFLSHLTVLNYFTVKFNHDFTIYNERFPKKPSRLQASQVSVVRLLFIILFFNRFVKNYFLSFTSIKMSTLNSTFFHIFIVLPFCTIRSLFYCIFSLLGSAIVRLPLLPASHAPYFRSYASCFTSSSNSSPAE